MSIKTTITKRLVTYGLSIAAALSGGFLITQYEGNPTNKGGLHPVYLDVGGVPTACYGQARTDLYGRQMKLGMEYTDEECDKMLAQSIKKTEQQVDSVVRVPYPSEWMKASLISFTYNLGIGNLKSSTLLKKLNAKDYAGACNEMTKWVYANKKKLKGLVSRRSEENEWCLGNVPWDAQQAYQEIISNDIKERNNVIHPNVD